MKKKCILIVIIIFIVTGLFLYFNSENKFTNKVVNYNGNNLRISIDGIEGSAIPSSGNYYLVNYNCKSADTVVTWDRENAKLNVSNGKKKSGVACYLNFQSQPKLSDMKPGSYVSYVGKNGCSGNSCSGQNANYVSEDLIGYCKTINYQFFVNGWRIAYSKNKSAHLISAGATECMCTDSSGVSSNSSCSTAEATVGVPLHLSNLNTIALKYCNSEYAYGGVCDKNTSWAMNAKDFENILNKKLASNSCYTKVGDKSCGYANDLIDNGGYYWLATASSSTSSRAFEWDVLRNARHENSNQLLGVRPVLKLDPNVVVVGGSGTYEDPYQIKNHTFRVSGGTVYVNATQKSAVPLQLAGSDVATMCISVDSSACSNYIAFSSNYTIDWSSVDDGEKLVYVYYKNNSGVIVASMNKKIILDSVAPENSKVIIKDGNGLTRVLDIFSTGADSMCFSNTSSNIEDCTNWVNYSTSHRWRLASGTGDKTVYVFFKDKAGNTSSVSASTTVSSISEYIVLENFDDTSYDSNLTVSGTWAVVNGRFQSSALSNAANPGATVTSTSTIVFKPTVDSIMSFDYGVSSESGVDKFSITFTGTDSTSKYLVNGISGVKTGSITGIKLTSGVTYTITLKYVKDGSVAKNDDLAWVDNLMISS